MRWLIWSAQIGTKSQYKAIQLLFSTASSLIDVAVDLLTILNLNLKDEDAEEETEASGARTTDYRAKIQ